MGYVRKIVKLAKGMSKIQRYTVAGIVLIWIFFQFIFWSNTSYSIRHPFEYLFDYFENVAFPTLLLGILYIYFISIKFPHLLPEHMRKRIVTQKRKETLKKRVDQEWKAWVLHGLGDRLLLYILIPFSLWLMRALPNNQKIREWGMSVIRRFDLLELVNAISYPRSTNGYFLSITEYYWGDKHITFELAPTIGITKAKGVITKRLTTKLHKPVSQIKYTVQGNHLFVTVPLRWVTFDLKK